MQDGNDYFNLVRIATLSDELHDDFDITNTIFVGIHYLDRFDRREKYHPDGKQHENYKKFLMNEVIPMIKEQLPIKDRKSTRLNSSHVAISYAVFCLKNKKMKINKKYSIIFD